MGMNAIISVSNKTNLDIIVNHLFLKGYTIYSTGGTYKYTYEKVNYTKYRDNLIKIEDLTLFPEILDGRVKSLHPKIYGGILCNRNIPNHLKEVEQHNIPLFDIVIVNLYPFAKNNTIENIDIGGVSLLRASAKNYNFVNVLSNPEQYQMFIEGETDRKKLALEAFKHTSIYDSLICDYLDTEKDSKPMKIELKYGFNPHQSPCILETHKNPFIIVNGVLGYINVLDFIHGWLTVFEISSIINYPVFISMKHTSPAGLGVGNGLKQEILDIFGCNESLDSLSEVAKAYIKCRNGDPLSSFGDFMCSSDKIDLQTAKLIKKEIKILMFHD